MLATPGRLVQSVAQASFDAWTKYYRPDENTPNATVNYYSKGALLALALDLTLRCEGRGTLDDVMRALWQRDRRRPDRRARHRTHAARRRRPQLRTRAGGLGPRHRRAAARTAAGDAPASTWAAEAPTAAQRLGLRVSESALTGVQVKQVLRGSAGRARRARRRRRAARRQWLAAAPARRCLREQRRARRAARPAGRARSARVQRARRRRACRCRLGCAGAGRFTACAGFGAAQRMAGRLTNDASARRAGCCSCSRWWCCTAWRPVGSPTASPDGARRRRCRSA